MTHDIAFVLCDSNLKKTLVEDKLCFTFHCIYILKCISIWQTSKSCINSFCKFIQQLMLRNLVFYHLHLSWFMQKYALWCVCVCQVIDFISRHISAFWSKTFTFYCVDSSHTCLIWPKADLCISMERISLGDFCMIGL